MEFRILGPLEAAAGGRALELGGAKQRALLAVLLLNANEIVPTDRLIDELWGERPPETAAHVVQVYVSSLRKAFATVPDGRPPAEILQTRKPGYLIRLEPDELDLHRFERLLADGRAAAAAGDHARALELLGDGLGLWRGSPLSDFIYEPFAQAAIGRLSELQAGALEERLSAELALGRHRAVVHELEALVAAHPLREGLRGLLMRALYRSGRQAEALETYNEARRRLVDELGIDPSPALQELQRAVLNHDPDLEWAASSPTAAEPASTPARSILAVSTSDGLPRLTEIASQLAAAAPHEVIAVRLVDSGSPTSLPAAAAEVDEVRATLLAREVAARATAFTTADVAADVTRLAGEHFIDLLLLAGDRLEEGPLDEEVQSILEHVPCDVAIVLGAPLGAGPVVVPFGGSEHDWAALELAAWLARGADARLRVLGTTAEEGTGRRDASRLLAAASLAVQQLIGLSCEPVLLPAGAAEIVAAATDAGALVLAVPERWHLEGLGATRSAVLRDTAAPTLVVRRGVRPGGLSPPEGLTRYTWSLSGAVTA